MAKSQITKEQLTSKQFNIAFSNSEIIQHWRKYPVLALKDLLGIQLLDFQQVIFTRTWFAREAVWVITRNGSKTLSASTYALLTQLLYPEQEIWIVSRSGRQSKKLFSYVEKLATNRISQFGELPDIYMNEIYKAQEAMTGFSHDPSGHSVSLVNGSYIKTLNGNADNNRGERGTLVIFDEAGFMDENAIIAVEPYTMGDTSFKTSVDENFDMRTLPTNKPNQRLYISSASDKTSYFYKKFYDFSLRMLAGDNRYFTASITADVPLSPTLRGKKYSPLLSQAEIDSVMNQNPSKGMREFYNRFDEDSDDQIIKSHTIERNSTFILPELTHDKGHKYILAYDPASIADNSHMLAMKICHDEKRGYYGKVVNSVVFKDLAYKTGNKQMLYQDQVSEIRNYLVIYNGDAPEYQNIHSFEIDTGMGGAGIIHTHSYLLDWKDQYGEIHRGVIDTDYYDETKQREFPNAYDVLNMVEPTKNKNMIIERLIELMELGLIEFPQEYNNSGSVDIEDANGDIIRRNLTKEEAIALMSIDIMKEECKNIHRYKNPSSGRITYKLRPEMERKMNDDRFYTLALAASALYELREKEELSKNKTHKSKDRTVLKLFN